MQQEITCDNCKSHEKLFLRPNPFKVSENLNLCKNCRFRHYSALRNVKFFDASTTRPEGLRSRSTH